MAVFGTAHCASPKRALLAAVTGGVLLMACASASESPTADPLEAGFLNPPNAAKPRVWWHWMDGNVSREGIQKDLAWLHQVGIGGVHNVDGVPDVDGTPRVQPGKFVSECRGFRVTRRSTRPSDSKWAVGMSACGPRTCWMRSCRTPMVDHGPSMVFLQDCALAPSRRAASSV